ncbi:OLC1v1034344C1 [Oldenlandia corymbosa var. corymbosa]|uniref:OLC1v1034344C1 n=1 Tax=Oldenlandia corymbosa var. corymbosa TaxID=529605 RepID=A0AAV1CR62_OLDCO|nr:OLC1v1034344C1 [Oldenlandia corymbosa var. corymbosa]
MDPVDRSKDTVIIPAVSKDESGQKRVEKVEVESQNVDTLKHVEKKMIDKGVRRQDRHPMDGVPLGRQHKAGHGGKYTWEGPRDFLENEMDPAPAAIDENDPNYVDEEAEGRILRGEVSGVAGLVVGEIEVPKLAEEGVARIDVDPQLQTNL